MLPTVFSKIISMRSNFTMSENEIAQYILNNTEQIVTSTISAVAQNTHTSEASINRFCKKLGFKGFIGFKTALAQESFYNSLKQQNTIEDNTTVASVTRDYRHMLISTSAMLDEDIVNRAVENIKQAGMIYIFSTSSTELVAKDLENKFYAVGIAAKAVTDATSMRILAANARKNDLVFAISPTILDKDVYAAVQICKEYKATIISITSYDSMALNDLVDIKFITTDKIIAQNSISISNNLIFLYVIDVLYAALLKSDRILMQKKLNTDAIQSNNQSMSNGIYER